MVGEGGRTWTDDGFIGACVIFSILNFAGFRLVCIAQSRYLEMAGAVENDRSQAFYLSRSMGKRNWKNASKPGSTSCREINIAAQAIDSITIQSTVVISRNPL